jgi:hypothetical protein
MISEQKTQVWVAIIQIVVIIALALAFYTGPSKLLKALDEGTNSISASVLAGTYKATNGNEDPKSAVIAAANDTWVMFVHRPWQILEFGSIKMAEKHEDKILSMTPKSKARQAYIEKLGKDEEHFTTDWGVKRTGYLMFSFIPNLILFLVIFLLCILIWAYKILTIIFCIMGIFVFICALVPMFGGIRLLQNWGAKVIGSAAITIIVSFFLAVVFAFNTAVFKMIDVYGLMIVIILQVVIAVVIYVKRESLFELFTMVRLAASGSVPVNKQMRRDANIENRVMEYTRGLNLRRNKGSYSEDYDSGYDSNSSTYSEDKMKKRSSEYRKAEAPKPTYNGEVVGFKELYNEIEEDTRNDNESFKQLMKKAEEILERQYQILKESAEEKAQKLGKAPEYHSFVHKVNTREALGAKRFDNREVIAVASQLQRVLRAGGRTEDVYNSFEKEKNMEVKRPKNLVEVQIGQEKIDIDKDEAQKIEIHDISSKYTNEFNNDYSKKYDPQFMEELIKTHGHKQVRFMLDKMKEIQSKDKNIYNPAGYLVKGLKNNERDEVKPKANIKPKDNIKPKPNIKPKANIKPKTNIKMRGGED